MKAKESVTQDRRREGKNEITGEIKVRKEPAPLSEGK